MSKKKKVIIGVICAIVLLAGGITTALILTGDSLGNAQPGSIDWKKQQYGAICERGVTEGLETNTTEYGICTRDLGYKIKAIESTPSQQETSENGSSTAPTVSDDQTQEAKRAGCISLRATKLEDLIESNKQNGISESDTRVSYQSGIAQCNAAGL